MNNRHIADSSSEMKVPNMCMSTPVRGFSHIILVYYIGV